MREDPTSVFASGIVIENSDGPLDFDVSRVYTGKLEGELVFYIKAFERIETHSAFFWTIL